MRAGPFSQSAVIDRLNSYFVPVYISNEDYTGNGPASPEEKEARARIFREGRAAGLSVGTVHVYLLGPDGGVRDSMHVAQAAKTEELIKLLDKTVSELRLTPADPVLEPLPQSSPPDGDHKLILHLVSRSTDGRGAWSSFPVEDWIALTREEVERFFPPNPVSKGQAWAIERNTAEKILRHFHPATENNQPSKNQIERIELTGRLLELDPARQWVRLDGELVMQHNFYHKPDGRKVEVRVVGFAELDVENRRVRSFQLVTTRGTYNQGNFAVAVQKLTAP